MLFSKVTLEPDTRWSGGTMTLLSHPALLLTLLCPLPLPSLGKLVLSVLSALYLGLLSSDPLQHVAAHPPHSDATVAFPKKGGGTKRWLRSEKEGPGPSVNISTSCMARLPENSLVSVLHLLDGCFDIYGCTGVLHQPRICTWTNYRPATAI